jgi:DUF1680 family protein
VEVKFDIKPRLVRANPLVREDAGRVAVERGPVVYCIESADQPGLGSLFDAELASPGEDFGEEFRANLLDGIVRLRHGGVVAEELFEEEPLYQTAATATSHSYKPAELVFIPYYAWANRGQDAMEVWVPLHQEGSGTR